MISNEDKKIIRNSLNDINVALPGMELTLVIYNTETKFGSVVGPNDLVPALTTLERTIKQLNRVYTKDDL